MKNNEIVLDEPKGKMMLRCLKSAFFALVISLVCILIFAFVIKLTGLSDGLIKPINQVIKAVSIFGGIFMGLKTDANKRYLKGIFIGIVYTIIAFVVFSILNGGFSFDKSIITDLIFGGAMGAISGVITSLIRK